VHNNVLDDKTLTNEQTSIAASKAYQRRWVVACCIMPGEMDDGGLARVRESGLTIGMGFLDRIADG